MARNHKAGGQGEPHAARMGELLPSRHRQQGVSGTRQLRSDAVAPVVAVQAQNQASQGRDLSTSASLRALWARTRSWAGRRLTWDAFNQIKERTPLLKPKLHLPYGKLQALAVL